MIAFNFQRECSGCGACGDACPSRCISMDEDSNGFIIPVVDQSRCIECHRCEHICPTLNNGATPYARKKCYVVYHRAPAIRHQASSGGAFYALALHTLERGGIVYAAVMDANMKVRHIRATDVQGVLQQMKSKYVQSDTAGIYRHIQDDLRDDKQVLFVGTPCQCKALHNMTASRRRDKLLLVDFVCHGVPSQNLFHQSIRQFETRHNCKVTEFSFREKTDNELRNYKVVFRGTDGLSHTLIGELDEIPFCNGYFNRLTCRNSCYECKHRNVERSSDLTLGDFWGLQKICPEIRFTEGYSSLVTNSDKGEQAVCHLKECTIQELPDGVNFVIRNNKAYTKADSKSLMRSLFFFCLRHLGYPVCERHFLSKTPSLAGRALKSLVIRIDKLNSLIKKTQ